MISAEEIKNMSIIDSFMEIIKTKLIFLKFGNYVVLDEPENLHPFDFEQIKVKLNHLGYYCKRFIYSYKNTNKCDELGCLVYHVPEFEPIYKIAISLEEDHLLKMNM